jgi:hypothetical protein
VREIAERVISDRDGAYTDRVFRDFELLARSWLARRDEKDQEFDAGRDAVLGEIVCSVCGENHDRDESAACDGCEAITFEEWTRRAKAELLAQRDVVAAAREFVGPKPLDYLRCSPSLVALLNALDALDALDDRGDPARVRAATNRVVGGKSVDFEKHLRKEEG